MIDEYDYTQSDLGGVIGKSRSHVANTLRLLKLPPQVQKLVTSGDLSAGHARALVTANDPLALANRIVKEGLSVRQAEELGQIKEGEEEVIENFSQRVYYPQELDYIVKFCGFEILDKLGDFDYAKFESDSETQILILKKIIWNS